MTEKRDNKNSGSTGNHIPPIYSVPTTETFDTLTSFRPQNFVPTSPQRNSATSATNSSSRRQGTEPPNYDFMARPPPPPPLPIGEESKRKKGRDFQRDEWKSSVRVKYVNIEQRSVFPWPVLPSLEEYDEQARQSNYKISPSREHLQVLHALHEQKIIPQLDFSSNTSRHADVPNETKNQDGVHQRGGAYQAIDLAAAVLELRNHGPPPQLSHKRQRLPNAADVGFQATEDEIRNKQAEINNETMWEEHSPRLALVVSSEHLGTLVEQEKTVTPFSREQFEWNAGGLPGMPFAGPELIQTFQQNAVQLGTPSQRKQLPYLSDQHQKCTSPDPCHVLAPPLGATYSPSQHWRPRPYHDRPHDLSYLLAVPSIHGLSPDDERQPLVACLSLYLLPSEVSNGEKYGKISEDFWFPAGHWSPDKLQAETVPGWMAAGTAQRKAIFSFSDLDIPQQKDIFLVLQVYRFAHVGSMSSPDEVFRQFGSQLLDPIRYGLARAFESNSSMCDWPDVLPTSFELHFWGAGCNQERFTDLLLDLVKGKVSPTSATSPTQSRKKKNRFFLSPLQRKGSRKQVETLSSYSEDTDEAPFASIELSKLPVDFLQVILAPEKAKGNTTKLLCDTSGDFAVSLDPDEPDRILPVPSPKKRSDILRLPPSPSPASYSASAIYREILYLRPRMPRHYDVDEVFFNRMVNFLYLYPHSLYLSGSEYEFVPLVVRFRLLRAVSKGESVPGRPRSLRVFYSRTPWCGKSLVENFYTEVNIPRRKSIDEPISDSLQFGGEVKIRLPYLLDKSYKLEVTLFRVNEEGDGQANLVAQTLIPLVSSSRDKDLKVSTVIPNGLHRIQLGQYQLTLETRLMSSIHVCDPLVDGIFRGVVNSNLHGASENSILCHLSSLAIMVLTKLCNKTVLREPKEESLPADMGLLLALLSQIKSCRDSLRNSYHYRMKLKHLIDMVGESCFTIPNSFSANTDQFLEAQDPINNLQEPSSEAPFVLQIKRDPLSSPRLRPEFVAKKATGVNRVPYGASKIDRMKVEGELRSTGRFMSLYYDDDETIATSSSLRVAFVEKNPDDSSVAKPPSIQEASSNQGKSLSFNHDEQDSSRATEQMLERLRTAAKVMLAPCVAPEISDALAGKCTSPAKTTRKLALSATYSYDLKLGMMEEVSREGILWYPGSDCESRDTGDAAKMSSQLRTILRTPNDGPLLRLTIRRLNSVDSVLQKSDFLYESLISMWLKSWLAHVEYLRSARTGEVESYPLYTFPVPNLETMKETSISIMSFYLHQEFLLGLCLKSIMLRSFGEADRAGLKSGLVMLDREHLDLLDPFVEVLARGLLGRAVGSNSSNDIGDEKAIFNAIASTEHVVAFILGLSSCLHADHLKALVEKFFRSLRRAEAEAVGGTRKNSSVWSPSVMQTIRAARQVRLRAIEIISTSFMFIPLNFPSMYGGRPPRNSFPRNSWLSQFGESPQIHPGVNVFADGTERLPESGWLVNIFVKECLSICSLSCEAVVAEAIKTDPRIESLGHHFGRDDLLDLQSIALHAVTVCYELGIRRSVCDKRFQSESARLRIASLFIAPVFEQSIEATRWLARMDPSHKVRSTWLLSLLFVFQESPDGLTRDHVQSLCRGPDIRVHRLVRLLRLCSSTFQNFVEVDGDMTERSMNRDNITSWLLQESFNTVCAAANIIVEECLPILVNFPLEERKLSQGVFDLFLHMLTTPQSPVTRLRALAGALSALELIGIETFLETTGVTFEHWARIVLSLMNSPSLSVRSIAVDFLLTLFGGSFQVYGSPDSVMVVMATILPEVVAREMALCWIEGHVNGPGDANKIIWPLRRALADLEAIDPADDDRIDPLLVPSVVHFCRASQAIIDSVLIELSIEKHAGILGSDLFRFDLERSFFDADEESIFEVVSYFSAESSPVQKLRWLCLLQKLHILKSQFVEAAEACFQCADCIIESLKHLSRLWRPSRFVLWSDNSRSPWLDTIGEDRGIPEQGNARVVEFADSFLEPYFLFGTSLRVASGKSKELKVSSLCQMLIEVTTKGIVLYNKEAGMEELIHYRVEQVLHSLMNSIGDLRKRTENIGGSGGLRRSSSIVGKRKEIEDDTAIQHTIAKISAELTKINGKVLEIIDEEGPQGSIRQKIHRLSFYHHLSFVGLCLSGKKPEIDKTSGSIPCFLEHGALTICRIRSELPRGNTAPDLLCIASSYIENCKRKYGKDLIVTTEANFEETETDASKTYLHIIAVEAGRTGKGEDAPLVSRHFYHKKESHSPSDPSFLEITLAKPAPFILSRQRALVTSEIGTKKDL